MKNKNQNLFQFLQDKVEFSIRLKLSLKYIRILTATLAVAGIGAILIFGIFMLKEKADDNYSRVVSLLTLDAQILDSEIYTFPELEEFSRKQHTPVLLFDRQGTLIWGTETALAKYKPKTWIKIVRQGQDIYLARNQTVSLSGGPVQLVIFTEIREPLGDVIRLAKAELLLMALLLFLAAAAVIRSGQGIFRPIKEMTQTVKHISEENLNLRLNVSGAKDELKELALTFNEMMNRIEDNYNRQKQFVSDASHELRTPIAVIQGYAVMLDRWGKEDPAILQESIAAIKNEAENMNELIDKLLFLARHDNSTFVFEKEEFSLTEMIQDIFKETQIIDSRHKISCDIRQEISLFADKNRMKQAIRIFIDNAIKYTPPGGEIKVSLGQENNYILIRIQDSGVGMSPEELKHIFDRFYRADRSRTKEKGGHGLGLAIAKIIILGHNGKIKVRSKLGEGSEFIIMLPEKK